jgi:GEVED domain/Secretion system C-terminal sorting domain
MKHLITLFFITCISLIGHAQNFYCETGLGGNCASRSIADVSMANMTNINNGCTNTSGDVYTNFTNNPTLKINVVAGQTYNLTVKVNGSLNAKMAAWIDWNHDTTWAGSTEFYPICTTAGGCLTSTIAITVPLTAYNGLGRLRIRTRLGTAANFAAGQDCANLASGETEDYIINVSGGQVHYPYCIPEDYSLLQSCGIGSFALNGVQNLSIPNAVSMPVNNPAAVAFNYSNFTNLTPINLFTGSSYPISITEVGGPYGYFTPVFAKAWIDFNHDTIFGINEVVYVDTKNGVYSQDPTFFQGGNLFLGSTQIPNFNPGITDTGITGMRILIHSQPINGITPQNWGACWGTDAGETEDYYVNIQIPNACAGLPVNTPTLITRDSVCPGDAIAVSLSNAMLASGLTYQWQSSTNSVGPYTNIAGATSSVYIDTAIAINTYYICQITCTASGQTSASLPINYIVKPSSKCYCASVPGGGANIGKFKIGNFSNGTCITPILNNPCANQTYSNFTNLAPINLSAGFAYPTSIYEIHNFNNYYIKEGLKIWIDLDQDGVFQNPGEVVFAKGYTQDTCSKPLGNILSGMTLIPTINGTSVKAGITRMRLFLADDSIQNVVPCGGAAFDSLYYGYYGVFGEVEDYRVNIQNASACVGTPIGGTVIASDNTVCAGDIVDFYLQNASSSGGLTYQWTLNGIAIPGATNSLFTDTIFATGTYQCTVTCEGSNQSSAASSVTVSLNPFTQCYCISKPSCNYSVSGHNIGQFTANNFSNGTASPIYSNTSATNSYSNFTTLPPIPLFSGTINGFKINAITVSNSNVFTINPNNNIPINCKIYIDYNHDGTYDPITESISFPVGKFFPSSASIMNANVLIPSTALIGVTGMRVRLSFNTSNPTLCGAWAFGETGEIEDYLVNIQPAPACAGTPNAAVAYISDSLVCPNTPLQLGLSSITNLTAGISYQWQSAASSTGPYFNLSNTNPNITINAPSTPTYYQCLITCANSGASFTSNPLFINIKPFYDCNYCTTNLGNNVSFPITNVQFNTLNNTDTFGFFIGNQAYQVFPDTGQFTTTLIKGASYLHNINIYTPGGLPPNGNIAHEIAVFIDYDHDGIFNNSTERTDILPFNPNNLLTNFSVPFSIPSTADTGKTRMRIRSAEQSILNVAPITSACNQINGQTQDYFITIQELFCSGTPIAGSVQSTDTLVCPTDTFNLFLNGAANSAGISYQWFANGVLLINDTLPGLTINGQTQSTNYTCLLYCINSGLQASALSLTVGMETASNCLCISSSTIATGEDIGQISLGNFSNGSGCTPVTSNTNANSTGYSNFMTSIAPIAIDRNVATPMSVCIINDTILSGVNVTAIKVFIDTNANYIFEPNEEFAAGLLQANPNARTLNTNITIGATKSDTIAMRVIAQRAVVTGWINPCGVYYYGETEDYLLVVNNTNICTSIANPGSIQSTDSTVCNNQTFALSLIGYSNAPGITYQWYANGTALLGDTLPIISNITQSSNTNYTCVLTCANSGVSNTSSGLLVNMGTPLNCLCIPNIAGCNNNILTFVDINNQISNTGLVCPPLPPSYTSFTAPVFTANPGDTTFCEFGHDTSALYPSGHFVSMWIDYNDDFIFNDTTERVITNLFLDTTVTSVPYYFSTMPDTGLHKMRIIISNLNLFNPSACGPSGAGETEDYLIHVSDTVTTYTGITNTLNRNTNDGFKVYPNPSTGIFKFELPNAFKNYTIKVTDLLGRTILVDRNKKQIDLSAYKNGAYTLIIIDEKTRLEKIIILNK